MILDRAYRYNARSQKMKQFFRSLICGSCAALIGITSISSAFAAENNQSFQITFNNEANNSAIKHVYLVLKGSINGKPCFMKISKLASSNDPTVSQCVPVTAATKPVDYAYDAVKGASFRVPPLSSGRMYVSINKPLSMHINPDATVAEPSVYDTNLTSNPDYNTMFDKVEFTYNPDGSTFFNPTAVDFLSLPISVAQDKNVYGLTTDRATAFSEIQHTFDDEIATKEYQRLLIKNNNVLLRILAPGRDSNSFAGNYLDSYIDWLFNTYYFSVDGKTATHTLSLQLAEASGVVPDKPRVLSDQEGVFSGFVKMVGNEKSLVLANSLGDTVTIKRSSLTSNSLFMAAVGNIDVKISDQTHTRIAAQIQDPSKLNDALTRLSNGYKAVAIKFITSAWAVGLLPVPNGDVLDQQYIRGKIGTDVKTIYTERAPLPADLLNRGPWYQLYGKAIHLLTPHLYAFPYDDVFGLDGTNAENDTYPAVVTLNDMSGSAVSPPAAIS
jgi:hypothetical protein